MTWQVRTACALLLAGVAAGCAPAGAPVTTPEHLAPVRDWRFRTAEHVALWYHGLAHTGSPAVDAQQTLPLFDAGWVRRSAEARRAAGVAATPLEQRAGEFTTAFRAATAWRQLEFLPLYFDNTDALLGALRVWEQVGGDPRRAGNRETAAAVALLSSMFPQPAQRRLLSDWRGVLEAERRDFFEAWWSGQQASLERLAAEAEAVWAPMAAPLRPLLASFGLQGGDVFLVPALGPEGRLLPQGAGRPRVAVTAPAPGEGVPGQSAAQQVVYSFLHELMYPLAGEAVREHVAPARLRELGEAELDLNAAVRAGALALERLAPAEAAAYRRYFVHSAGQAGVANTAQLGAAFARAFPLPAELEAALPGVVERALAGI